MEDEKAKAPDDGFTPITTQEQFDALIKERIERARRSAVPSDYDELKAKADRLDEVEARGASELASMTERAEVAEAERDMLRHDAEVTGWKADVSARTGVPASVLRGDTLEEIQSHADAIRGAMPVYPLVSEGAPAAAPMGKQEILGIENARERRAAILANLDLFD